MELKNCKFTRNGSIDCEYLHEKYGWIPFTANENDSDELSRNVFTAAKTGQFGDILIYTATSNTEQIKSEIISATQLQLDDFAKTRNYDSILSATSYATSTIPKFATEGQYAVNARDNTWATLYDIMATVQAGTRPMPASFADIESELPVLAWPT